jgi:hypothetical protein
MWKNISVKIMILLYFIVQIILIKAESDYEKCKIDTKYPPSNYIFNKSLSFLYLLLNMFNFSKPLQL